MEEKREQWGSRFGFLMAAAGAAIGLGNIWRFPYVTGKFGGAAFLAFYLLLVFTLGLSITIAEWAIGRAGRSDSVGSFRKLGGGAWSIVGWFGFFAALVILSYYSVIVGWILYYLKYSFTGLLSAVRTSGSENIFITLITKPNTTLAYHFISMLVVVAITIKGVSSGIERFCKILMPGLFILLLILVARSLSLPGALEGVKFYLVPDFSKLGKDAMLTATGQAFYSLSLSMGITTVYGSYLDKDVNFISLARIVVGFDTLVAFLAGLIIFPACMAFNIVPNAGAGLAFIALPSVFAEMPFGELFAAVFFLLFFIAAITSAIALFEVVVAYGIDQIKMSRKTSTILMGLIVFALGLPSALAETPLIPTIFGKSFLDAADFVINNWMIPLTAIFTCIFVGWIWTKGAKNEITNSGTKKFKLYPVWLFICRFVAPILLAVLLISGGKW